MTDFSWKDKGRASGVFLHITSLPSTTGIGNFGSSSKIFAEFLASAGFKYWQICPNGPTGFGDSPYQSFSAFAGNPYFIDLEPLREFGLLSDADMATLCSLPQHRCDYENIYKKFPPLLKRAFENSKKDAAKISKLESFYGLKFADFCKSNAYWLDYYAYFMALKNFFGGASWDTWPAEIKCVGRFKKSKLFADKKILDECECVKFIQWLYSCCEKSFRQNLAQCGVEIIADMPIFLSYDSADVWEHPELFDLDESLKPNNVAGVGPDYFSEKGQLWGNPLYDWKNQKKELYEFWFKRIEKVLNFASVIRLDHFRGFADYWEIPYGSIDARKGKMRLGPGVDFFEQMRKKFPQAKFIAEDLGLLSQTAIKLRDDINIPAMTVLQFAFGCTADNPYLPHNHKPTYVCYTGTHDNDTSCSWYETQPEKTKDHFRRYMRVDGSCANWDMICAAMKSVSFLAVLLPQDILGLGAWARFNTPGESQGNWQWRLTWELFEELKKKKDYLKELNEMTFRYTQSSAVKNFESNGA